MWSFLWVTFTLSINFIGSSYGIVVDTNETFTLAPDEPIIFEYKINTGVRNRYARTTILQSVRNPSSSEQNYTFLHYLPPECFISGFTIVTKEKEYKSKVKKRSKNEENPTTKDLLDAPDNVQLVRDANRFSVTIIIKPKATARFQLLYERQLKRKKDVYKLYTNVLPGQYVDDLSVELVLHENHNIKNLKVLPLQSVVRKRSKTDSQAEIKTEKPNLVKIIFQPDKIKQLELVNKLNDSLRSGFQAQFVVEYDVERDQTGGELITNGDYFVHFFAPQGLSPLPKYVVFVLDTSASMNNSKIEQLKLAMASIIDELNSQDMFSLVQFSNLIRVWNLKDQPVYEIYKYNSRGSSKVPTRSLSFPVTPESMKKAKDAVLKFEAIGGTDIYYALEIGLHLISLNYDKYKLDSPQPYLIFLTDGYPLSGIKNRKEILQRVEQLNSGDKKSTIFALGFGQESDRKFLEELSIRNLGLFKHIYEEDDASEQMRSFYQEIKEPVLAKVHMEYPSCVKTFNGTNVDSLFAGSEFVTAGKAVKGPIEECLKDVVINAVSSSGSTQFKPKIEKTDEDISRQWSYNAVQDLYGKHVVADLGGKLKIEKEIAKISLRNGFMTELTPIEIETPNGNFLYEIGDGKDFIMDLHDVHEVPPTIPSITLITQQLQTTPEETTEETIIPTTTEIFKVDSEAENVTKSETQTTSEETIETKETLIPITTEFFKVVSEDDVRSSKFQNEINAETTTETSEKIERNVSARIGDELTKEGVEKQLNELKLENARLEEQLLKGELELNEKRLNATDLMIKLRKQKLKHYKEKNKNNENNV